MTATPTADSSQGPPTSMVGITGMHRSGTSLMARAVNLLGLSLGSTEALMEPGDDNPAGYWENLAIKELNDELLTDLGGAWDEPPVLDPGWETDPTLGVFHSRAAEIFERHFADAEGPMGFKEPRLCLLLPFWRAVIPIPTTVVVVRHPAEVAASLARRNNLAQPHAAVLWLRHLLSALHEDPGALVVRHRDLNTDLEGTLARMADHLELAAPTSETIDAVRDHIDPDLDHHAGPDDDPSQDHSLLALARTVWNDADIDPSAVPEPLATNLRTGWLAPPAQREALAAARGQVVALRDTLRKRKRAARAAEARARATGRAGPGPGPQPTIPNEKAEVAHAPNGSADGGSVEDSSP